MATDYEIGYSACQDELGKRWVESFRKIEDRLSNIEKREKAFKLMACKRCKKKIEDALKLQEALK